MKYIRTKDKILIAPDLYDNGGVVLTSDPPMYETRNAKNEWGCVDCDKVIKQADTIEELCDEFVAIGYGLKGKPAVVIGNNGFETIKTMLSNYEIYGAIWTDKGLIYVAKMNDKGELCLI